MALWIKLRLPGGAVVKKKKKKNLPANTGDARDAGSILGREDPLEEEMATHSSVPGKFRGQKSLMGYSSWGCKETRLSE